MTVTAPNSDLLRAALDYAARGWPVLPLKPGGKEPLGSVVRRGFLDATTDARRIGAWWERHPNANVGIRCSTFDVLDVDGPLGERALAELEKRFGKLPESREHATGRGRHLLFAPSGLPKSVGRLGLGLDTIGTRLGYIVAPPSVHENGTAYTVEKDVPLVAAPAWLVALAQGADSLGVSEAVVQSAPEGKRNDTLNVETFRFAKNAGTPKEAEKARRLLQAAAERQGLPTAEARRTSMKAMHAGLEASARNHTRYKRVPEMLFKDRRFQNRKPSAKHIALNICSSPEARAIPGVAVMSLAALSAETSLTEQALRVAIRELSRCGLLRSDTRVGLFWLPSVTKEFSPNSDAQRRAWRNALGGLPRCSLRDDIEAAVSGHFRAQDPAPTKQALKVLGVKGERSPLLPAPSPGGLSYEDSQGRTSNENADTREGVSRGA